MKRPRAGTLAAPPLGAAPPSSQGTTPRSLGKPNARGARCFALIGLVALGLLLYRFWFGESGWFAVRALAEDVAAQHGIAEELAERNRLLTVEVLALKTGLDPVEARARTDLGMVAEGETFYLVAPQP